VLHTLLHLIFGCFMLDMTHLLCLWASSIVHENPHMSIFLFLKCTKQHCNPSKSNWIFVYLFGLFNKIITYTKDKGFNLWNLTNAWTSVVFCSPLDLSFPIVRSSFGNAMSKATKYIIDDTKVCARFSNLNWKNAQASLHKTIIWKKNLAKGRKMEGFLYHYKVVNSNVQNTRENNILHLIILLQEIWFKYQNGISICYGWQQFLHFSFKVPSYQTWLIV